MSASAADSPSATVGTASSITSRAGTLACLPSTSTRLRSSASVTSPNRPSSSGTTAYPVPRRVIAAATSPTGSSASTSSGRVSMISSTRL